MASNYRLQRTPRLIPYPRSHLASKPNHSEFSRSFSLSLIAFSTLISCFNFSILRLLLHSNFPFTIRRWKIFLVKSAEATQEIIKIASFSVSFIQIFSKMLCNSMMRRSSSSSRSAGNPSRFVDSRPTNYYFPINVRAFLGRRSECLFVVFASSRHLTTRELFKTFPTCAGSVSTPL